MRLTDTDRPRAPPLPIPWTGLVGAGGMMVLALIVFNLAHAPNTRARLDQARQDLSRLESLAGSGTNFGTYPAGSVCAGALDTIYHDTLTTQLKTTGLEVAGIDMSEPQAVPEISLLQVQKLHISGKGSYEAAMQALSTLAKARPIIFVDKVSLKNRLSQVELDIDGRVFCNPNRSH